MPTFIHSVSESQPVSFFTEQKFFFPNHCAYCIYNNTELKYLVSKSGGLVFGLLPKKVITIKEGKTVVRTLLFTILNLLNNEKSN